MAESINSQIKKALEHTDAAEEAKRLITSILGNFVEIEKAISSRIVVILGLAIANELVASAKIAGVSAFGIQVTDLSILRHLLPVIMAYLYYSLFVLVSGRRIAEEAYDLVFRRAFPVLNGANMNEYCRIISTLKLYNIIYLHTSGKWEKLSDISNKIMSLAIISAPPAYLLWSIVRNSVAFGYLDILTILSGIFCVILVSQAIFVMFATMKGIYGADAGLGL